MVLQHSNAAQPGTMTGAVMGVEKQKAAAGKDAVEVEQFNLWCADGMRSVKLADVQRVRFLNPVLEGEVRKLRRPWRCPTTRRRRRSAFISRARAVARSASVMSSKTPSGKPPIASSWAGEGGQSVLAGLGRGREVTDEDGVTFAWPWSPAALFPSGWTCILLFMCRGPTVVPELFASLRPVTYNGDVTGNCGVWGVPEKHFGASPKIERWPLRRRGEV